MLAAIQSGNVRVALFYEGQFNNGSLQYIRLWTGVGSFTWNGSTWIGAGNLLNVAGLEESAQTKAMGFTVSMSGLPQEKIALALTSTRRGLLGKVWLVVLGTDDSVVASYLLKQGRFNSMPIEDSGETATVTAHYDDLLETLQQPRERRYDTQSQALRDSTDRGFEYVEALQNAVFEFF
jgi:hypothetical protein